MRKLLERICSLPDLPTDHHDYIQAWKKVGAKVSYHQFNLAEIYRGFFNDGLDTFELLSILIAMLPNDKTLLTNALAKLEIATVAPIKHLPEERKEARFCLTNILAAITYKLDPNKAPSLPIDEETHVRKIVTKVVNEIRQVKELAKACKDFKNLVMNEVEKIIARFPEIHALYFTNPPQQAREDIFLTISNDMLPEVKKFPLKDDAPSLAALTQKMTLLIALFDIDGTLKRADSHNGRAKELHEKLKKHNLILQQQSDNKTLQFFKDIGNYTQYLFSSAARFFVLSKQYKLPIEDADLKPPTLGNP